MPNKALAMGILCTAGVLIIIVGVIAIQLAMNWYRTRQGAIEAYNREPTNENKLRMEASKKRTFPIILIVATWGLTHGIVALAINLVRWVG